MKPNKSPAKRNSISFRIFVWILRILVLIFAIFPLYSTVIVSLTPYSNIMEPMLYPKYMEVYNFALAIESVGRQMLNSFVYSLISVFFVLLFSIPSAYTIARFHFKGRKVMMFLLLWTQMLAGIVIMPSIYVTLIDLQIIDKAPTLIFLLAGVNLPLTVWLLVGFFAKLPVEIEEAALIDGVGCFGLIRKIILPISMPGIAVSATFAFVNAYNDFVIPLFTITSPEKMPLTMRLNSLISENTIQWHILSAGSLIGLLPPLILFLVFQKYIIGGVTAGAVKG